MGLLVTPRNDSQGGQSFPTSSQTVTLTVRIIFLTFMFLKMSRKMID